MANGALADLKVVEYAHFISGPFCAKLLADLGAEVVKVEEPGIGDEARRREPFLNDVPHPERSGLFLYLNTNKLGATLNLRSKTGIKLFGELIKGADILIENNPPLVMKELGLDYESLKELNPRLVMTSITPFGQTGPYRDYKAGNLVSIHLGGIGYLIPRMVKNPEKEPPLKGGGHQADFATAIAAAVFTMSAILARQATGQGEHIDLSEHEAVATNGGRTVTAYSYEKTIPGRLKPAVTGAFGLIACKDGYFQLHSRADREWRGLMEVMGNPEWGQSEMFRDLPSRSKNLEAAERLIQEWAMGYTKDEVYRACQAHHIACSPVNTFDEVVNSEQLAARGFFVETEHQEAGRIKYPGAPYHFSQTPWQVVRPAPLLGEHNEEIFCNRLGYSRQDLAKMRQAGVI